MPKPGKISSEPHDEVPNTAPESEDPEDVFDKVVPKWYDQPQEEEKVAYEPPSDDELSSIRAEAEQILEQETAHYHSKVRKGKAGHDANWLKTMLSKGTSKDKMAAHIISVQNAPQFNIVQLQKLIGMVKASKQRDCISVMENLAELFLEDLLIPSRKLKTLDKQPITKLFEITSGCARTRKTKLVLWLFEEKLKEAYHSFILAVDGIAKDTVDSNRMKAVTVMNRLLSGHPEQEQFLLKNIINKLGDPNQKVVSKVMYCLTQLLRVHPNMKQVVMNEVEKFLFRPNQNKRPQYYSICFLTQYIFQNKDRDLARNIINIYFSFFKAAIKKGEIDSKLMGALLIGVKRAHPFAKLTPEVMREHTDTLYKLVHLTPFNISLHALCLLQEVSTQSDDRFYSALYKKLLDPDISKSCHQAILINLLYKAITKDSNIPRIKAIIKRLFQVCMSVPSPLACGFLYLISHLLSKRRQLLSLQTIPLISPVAIKIEDDDDDDNGDEKYFDVDRKDELEGNGSLPEVKVEVKSEDKNEDNTNNISTENNLQIKDEPIDIDDENKKPVEGWVFKNLIKARKSHASSNSYDPYARNPSFANADKSAYFELLCLTQHFHPSVALFAKKILTSEKIIYSGDPLADFTLVRFLDRFCFKNPKKINEEVSGPEPALAKRRYYKPVGVKSMPVLSQSYLSQDMTQIPVDEHFLYKYLKEKHGDGVKFTKKDEDDDNDSVASEEFEEMLEGMMGGKKTKGLDFMEDVGDKLKKKKGAKANDDDDDDDFGSEVEDADEEDMDEDVGDGEGDDGLENDDEPLDFEGRIDGEAIDFSDDGDDDDEDIDLDNEFFNKDFSQQGVNSKKDKFKNIKKVKGLRTKGGLESLFAPAEEFAEILEEAGASKEKPGMIQSLSNKDNAAQKQLSWETKRDRWVRGVDERKRKFKGHYNKKFNGAKKGRKN